MYLRPNNLSEAIDALAASRGQILSGGTDFFPALGDGPISGSVIDVSRLGELRGIRVEPEYFFIGGLTTWTQVIQARLPRCFDALKLAAREIGSVQIQNRGTVAGNLCNASPAADSVPPLLALNAEVELTSRAGVRRVRLSDFIVGNRKTVRRPDEILSHVLVPHHPEGTVSTFAKLGARRYLVISIAMVAVVLVEDRNGTVADARVSVGSCSVVATRLRELEARLIGEPARSGLGLLASAEHLRELSPIDDVRATAAYRCDAGLSLVRRAIDHCVRDL